MNFKTEKKFDQTIDDGIHLKHLRLKFSHQQLQQLNGYFSDLETNKGAAGKRGNLIGVRVYIEKLLLQLNYIIGNLDPRFSSTFLIRLDSHKVFFENSATFSYLIRLDELSSPLLYDELPSSDKPLCRIIELCDALQGFGKIQLKGYTLRRWIDFVNNAGYLRNDKIVKKYAQLLMSAIRLACVKNEDFFSQQNKADFRYRCSPSFVVDADTLHRILKAPPEQRLFYGSPSEWNADVSGNDDFDNYGKVYPNFVFQDDISSCIKLKIRLPPTVDKNPRFGSENVADSDIILKLYIAVNFEGLPVTSDYPNRIPLFDTHILLHQQAASTGFYMVASLSQSAASICEDASVLWRFQFPAVEHVLSAHYANFSVVARVANIVHDVIANARRSIPGGRRVISKYIIKTFVWFQLEKFLHPACWTSRCLAYHTLQLLSDLAASLRTNAITQTTQGCRSFFFADFDLMKHASADNFLVNREDYAVDAQILETFIRRVHLLSSELIGCYQTVVVVNLGRRCYPPEYILKYENALLHKWNTLLNDCLDVGNEKSKKRIERGMYSADDCSRQQLEYIAQIMRGILFVHSVKSVDIEELDERQDVIDVDNLLGFPLIYNNYLAEYIMFIITVIIRQAVNLFSTTTTTNQPRELKTTLVGWRDYATAAAGITSSFATKRKLLYEKAVASFLDNVKTTVKDDLLVRDIVDDTEFARYILKLLLFKISQNKLMRRILKPYINAVLLSAHANCWFLNDWKTRAENNEFKSLRVFARLLFEQKISAHYGLMDALFKGWQWPVRIIKCMIKLNYRRLILFSLAKDGTVTSYNLTFNAEEMRNFKNQNFSSNYWTLRNRGHCGNEYLFNIFNPYFEDDDQNEICYKVDDLYAWCLLSNTSPATGIMDGQRRYGVHKYLGNVTDGLILLNKFSILQEISWLLPKKQRKLALEDIHFICREKYRSKRNTAANLPTSYGKSSLPSNKRRSTKGGGLLLSDYDDSQYLLLQSYRNLLVDEQKTNEETEFEKRRRKKSFITIISSAPSLLELPYEQPSSDDKMPNYDNICCCRRCKCNTQHQPYCM